MSAVTDYWLLITLYLSRNENTGNRYRLIDRHIHTHKDSLHTEVPCIELPTVHNSSASTRCIPSHHTVCQKSPSLKGKKHLANPLTKQQAIERAQKGIGVPSKSYGHVQERKHPREWSSPHFVVGYIARQYKSGKNLCGPAGGLAAGVWGSKAGERLKSWAGNPRFPGPREAGCETGTAAEGKSLSSAVNPVPVHVGTLDGEY